MVIAIVKKVAMVITIIWGLRPTPADMTTRGTYAKGGIFLTNWIQGSKMFLTGLYQAIRMATGSAMTKPNANPASTEIKLLPISLKKTPLSIIVCMDANTASTLGKLRDVWGLTDNNHHTSIAEAKEISSQMPFGILEIKLFADGCYPSLHVLIIARNANIFKYELFSYHLYSGENKYSGLPYALLQVVTHAAIYKCQIR